MAPRGHLGPALWGPPGPGRLLGAPLLLVVLGRPVGGHRVRGAGAQGVTAQVPSLNRGILGLQQDKIHDSDKDDTIIEIRKQQDLC